MKSGQRVKKRSRICLLKWDEWEGGSESYRRAESEGGGEKKGKEGEERYPFSHPSHPSKYRDLKMEEENDK